MALVGTTVGLMEVYSSSNNEYKNWWLAGWVLCFFIIGIGLALILGEYEQNLFVEKFESNYDDSNDVVESIELLAE